MTNLSVNINKVATIRNARGENVPDVRKFAIDCEAFGANGITVHPRPDERHITRKDVLTLRPAVKTEFNIEGYPSPEFMDLVLMVRPEQVTLVPDAPSQITSNFGWKVKENSAFLSEIVETLKDAGIRTSVFIDPDVESVKLAAATGTDRVELYTKPYAAAYSKNPEAAIAPYIEAAIAAHKSGMGVNAGHDLNLTNLHYFYLNMPYLNEVSIGHALISDALYFGLKETIRLYKECLRQGIQTEAQ